jgi:MotA/TolQ/ExbB proton channel family
MAVDGKLGAAAVPGRQRIFVLDHRRRCFAGAGLRFLHRWRDVQWLATNVVRLGLLGTVVGLIIAFSAATTGNAAADPSAVRPMITAVVNGMHVALYATLLGITVNLWLKINLRLLGDIDG